MRSGHDHRTILPLNVTEHMPEVFREGNIRPYNIGYALMLTLFGKVSL